MNDVQKFILNRAMQKVASMKPINPYLARLGEAFNNPQNQQQIPANNMNYDENEAYGFAPELVTHPATPSNIDFIRSLHEIQHSHNPYRQRQPLQGPASAISNNMNVKNPVTQQPQTQLPTQGLSALK